MSDLYAAEENLDESYASHISVSAYCKMSSEVPRPSLDKWSKTLFNARQAQEILAQCNRLSVDSWEADGVKGLAALFER